MRQKLEIVGLIAALVLLFAFLALAMFVAYWQAMIECCGI